LDSENARLVALQLAERHGRLGQWLDARTFADEAAYLSSILRLLFLTQPHIDCAFRYEYRVERWWPLVAAAVREAMRAAKALHDLAAYVNYALELLPRDMPGNMERRFFSSSVVSLMFY
jgi:hypothetical protein